MQFDRNKLRAVILHVCRTCPRDRLGAVKLHKVLYFLDMIQFAQAGNSVTGSTYRKRPYGPTCVQLLPTLAEMQREGELEVRDTDYYGLRKKEYVALVEEPTGILNSTELALLDEAVEFVCARNSAKSISEFSHQLPWEMVEFGEEITYDSALWLYPNQITPEAFSVAREGAAEVGYPRSKADTLDLPKLSAFRSRISAEVGRI